MFSWLRRRHHGEAVAAAYDRIVEQSRRPEFYAVLGVADTLDGRFDMLSMHMMLVLRRLKADPAGAGAFSQELFDYMFADMDQSLREIGVGDLSVGKRVKQMGAAFLGRIAAYEKGLCEEGDTLVDALTRNVYRDAAPDPALPRRLAAYMRELDASLAEMPLQSIIEGRLSFGGLKPDTINESGAARDDG